MAVYAICEECDREYRLADSMGGKSIRCKDCGSVVDVPPPGRTRSSRARSAVASSPRRSRKEKDPPRASRRRGRGPRRSSRRERDSGGLSYWQMRLIFSGIGAVCAIVASAMGWNNDDGAPDYVQSQQQQQQQAAAQARRSNQQLRDQLNAAADANEATLRAQREQMDQASQQMEADLAAMQGGQPSGFSGSPSFPPTGSSRPGMNNGGRSGIGRPLGMGSTVPGSSMPGMGSSRPGSNYGSGMAGGGRSGSGMGSPFPGGSIPGMGSGRPGIGRGSNFGSGRPNLGGGSNSYPGSPDRGRATTPSTPRKPAPKHPAFGKVVLETGNFKPPRGERASGFEAAVDSEVFVVGGQTVRIWRNGKWKEVASGVDWTGDATVFDLSTDGKTAAIVADVRLTTQIGSLDTETGEIKVASSHGVGKRAVGARLSRDGSRLCILDQWGTMGIFKLPDTLDASNKIATAMGSVEELEISNDGRKVVVISNGELFEVGDAVQKSKTQFAAKAYSVAPMADRVLVDFNGKLTLTDLGGQELASVETNDEVNPFFKKKGYARGPLQMNREGTLACFCTFRGRQCVIVGITDSQLTIKGALPLEDGLKPICARFTTEGRVAVLAEVGINDGYVVVVCDVSA